jgi:hypothetical protein
MKTKTILRAFMITTLVSTFIGCSKDNDTPEPTPEPTPTPADTRELVIQAQYTNYGSTPGDADTVVNIPNMRITIGGTNDAGTLLSYNENNVYTVNADANGVARFPYANMGSYGISGSSNIGIIAYNSPFYGAYNGAEYLSNTSFLFDDRNTYGTLNISLRAYMWQYLAGFTKWNLVAASVNGVAADVANSCNNDDYIVFEILNGQYDYAKLTYYDGANTCGGFPTTNPYISYSKNYSSDNNGNPSLYARYNTTTNKLETTIPTTIQSEYAGTSSTNFFGYGIITSVMGDTLTISSQETTNSYTVIKKFVAVP